jgi:hypothetical protein
MANQSATITAGNTFTTATTFNTQAYFNVSVEGTSGWLANVRLQKSYDSGSTWYDVNPDGVFTANKELIVFNADSAVQWRIGCPTGDYTKGTINVRLTQA